MWQRNKPLLQELTHLVGPDHLDLLSAIDVLTFPTSTSKETVLDHQFIVLFTPGQGLGGSGLQLSASQLSRGTRRILSLLSSLMFDQRAVVLLEEPEDSIHPGLLHKLLGLCRAYFADTQIIFSTHSQDVLNQLRPEELRLVTASDGATRAR